MSDLSDYMEGALIDHIFNKAAFTALTTFYIALSDDAGTPVDGSTGTNWTDNFEPSGGSYARKSVASSAMTRSGSTIDNDSVIEFAEATGSWGTITHVALMDAATNGNVICWKQLAASKAVASGDTIRFKAGELDFSMD